MSSALRIRGLVQRFGTRQALCGVDLELGAAEFLVVLGASGAGKTTLLRAIAGLETPCAGELELFGRDARGLTPAQRDVALVFQNFSLYPSKSVRENLAFALRAPGRALAAAAIEERVAWAAGKLRIEALLERPARSLSGGEMQRVAIGRAIVRRPRLFLMDEPLTNLDAKLREELRVELRELARELCTPTVWVTHDSSEALSMADRIAVLHEGRVLQCASPQEVYFRPASPLVALQLGTPAMNVLGTRGTALGALLAAQCAAGPAGRLGFRPEHVELRGGSLPARIEVLENAGPARVLLLDWGGAKVHALVVSSEPLCVGATLLPRVASERVLLWTD